MSYISLNSAYLLRCTSLVNFIGILLYIAVVKDTTNHNICNDRWVGQTHSFKEIRAELENKL